MEPFICIFLPLNLSPTTIHMKTSGYLIPASAAQAKPEEILKLSGNFPRKFVTVTFDTEFTQLLITKSKVLKNWDAEGCFVIPLSHCAGGLDQCMLSLLGSAGISMTWSHLAASMRYRNFEALKEKKILNCISKHTAAGARGAESKEENPYFFPERRELWAGCSLCCVAWSSLRLSSSDD